MKMNIGVASRDRFFGKAMTRLYPEFKEISNAIEALALKNPGFTSFLVGLTDDPAADGAEVVFRDFDTCQVMVGIGAYSRDETDGSLLTRSIQGMIEGLRLVNFDDGDDFQKMLTVFQAHPKRRS